jgi:hypothetical protein
MRTKLLTTVLLATSLAVVVGAAHADSINWGTGKASTVSPKFKAKISSRTTDASWTAKAGNLSKVPALSPDAAGKILGKKPGAWSFTRKLGPFEGTRVEISRDGIMYDGCIDFLNARTIASIIQAGARSGVVKMAKGSSVELHLPAAGSFAAVRFTVDGNSTWGVEVDGVAETQVTVKSDGAGSVGTLDLGVELGAKGSAAQFTTVTLKATGDSNFYNAEIAISDFQ